MNFPIQLEGQYDSFEKIGEGGMGSVYLARHRLLDEKRVIKIIRPEHVGDESLLDRFKQEAMMAARLRHPNHVQLYDFGVGDDGTAFIVMEFIKGITLENMLRDFGPRSVAFTIELALQSLNALRSLHREGFIHRDVAPDNLMLTRGLTNEPLVKLIDLGIAKATAGATTGKMVKTQAGVFLGKPYYAAPEQFSGHSVTTQSDIYSFGVTLYELLTGQCPIEGETYAQIAGHHILRPPMDFDVADPTGRVPQGLREVVLQALEKDQGQRIQGAQRFIELLQPFRAADDRWMDELNEVLRSTFPPVARPEPRRPPPSPPVREKTSAPAPSAPGSSRSDGKRAARPSPKRSAEPPTRREGPPPEPDEPPTLDAKTELEVPVRPERGISQARRAIATMIERRDLRGADRKLESAIRQYGEQPEFRQLKTLLRGTVTSGCPKHQRATAGSLFCTEPGCGRPLLRYRSPCTREVRSPFGRKSTCGYARNLESPMQRYCLGCGARLTTGPAR